MPCADALTARQAADAVRSRIDWKYALGLELTDAGFHDSVLAKFRTRLVTGGAEQMRLDVMLTRFHACGVLTAGDGLAPTPPMSWPLSGRAIAGNVWGKRSGPRAMSWRSWPRIGSAPR